MKYIFLFLLLVSCLYSQECYTRTHFKHWQDFDSDCQNTRAEVLIEENLNHYGELTYTSDKCKVVSGVWYNIYSGNYLFNAKDADVDHFVPLKDAWISGADKWSKEKREFYANYMGDKNHLIIVSSKDNRSKGDRSPDKWLPNNKGYHILYCKIWTDIKVKWGLTMSEEEYLFIKNILINEENIVYPLIRNVDYIQK
jgi:hypothetical protein